MGFTIARVVLTISAVSDTKVYDGTTSSSQTPTYQVTGLAADTLYGTDTVTGLVQAYQSKDVLGVDGSTLQVTAYQVNDGNDGADYTVTLETATGTITPATVTIAAVSDTKSYYSTTASSQTPTFQVTSYNSDLGESELGANTLYNSDAFTTLSESFDSANAGARTLTASFSIGGNYTVTSATTAAGTITPATVTIAAVSDTKSYDSTTASSQTPTFQVTSYNSDLGESELGANTLYNSDAFTTLSEAPTRRMPGPAR